MMAGAVAWVFPGQGSQVVGMGRDLCAQSAAARAVFDKADRLLGFPLSKVCFEGPEAELRRTDYAQPAIFTASLAALEAAREAGDSRIAVEPAFVAGHSLGEYTALVAAGALDFADGLLLVRERGGLMEAAGREVESGMAAVLGIDADALADACRLATAELPGEVVQVANINAPGQVIISGTNKAMARAIELARARGARRVVPLSVGGAFHSPVMAPAEAGLRRYLEGVRLRNSRVPVVGNVSARPLQATDELRVELGDQLSAPVRWQASVEFIASAGVRSFVEIGPGQVLANLVKRICPDVEVGNL